MGDDAARALMLTRKRQKEQEETAFRKQKIQDEYKFGSIDGRFSAKYDAIEERIKSETVGLVSLEEMRRMREKAVKEHDVQLALTRERRAARKNKEDSDSELHLKKKAADKSKLSFGFDDEEEDESSSSDDNKTEATESSSAIGKTGGGEKEEMPKGNSSSDTESDHKKEEEEREAEEVKKIKRRRFGMNPDVDTSFLPDREREEQEAKMREKLAREWRETQERIKNEDVDITYSYWDGSGHRRNVLIKKGFSIQQFLQKALENLRREFNEMRVVSVDQLMFVKEDLIIPQHYTFYELIVTKARGKSGPLFDFSVKDDIRLINDATVEKEESHAGKVCLRSWYERNKHIFPASRWEPYDPGKKWDKYTIKDGKAPAVQSTALTAPASQPPI